MVNPNRKTTSKLTTALRNVAKTFARFLDGRGLYDGIEDIPEGIAVAYMECESSNILLGAGDGTIYKELVDSYLDCSWDDDRATPGLITIEDIPSYSFKLWDYSEDGYPLTKGIVFVLADLPI